MRRVDSARALRPGGRLARGGASRSALASLCLIATVAVPVAASSSHAQVASARQPETAAGASAGPDEFAGTAATGIAARHDLGFDGRVATAGPAAPTVAATAGQAAPSVSLAAERARTVAATAGQAAPSVSLAAERARTVAATGGPVASSVALAVLQAQDTIVGNVHSFASEFSSASQGDLSDSDLTNNWRYMWRESFDFDDVSPKYASNCDRTGDGASARKCQDMPVLTVPPVRALRWLEPSADRGWFYVGAGIDRLRGWHPRYDKRVVVGWTSPYDVSVKVNITGIARLTFPIPSNPVGAAGVRVAVYSGDHELIGWRRVANLAQGMHVDDVLLHSGDELFFMVDASGTDFGDGLGDRTEWTPTITVTEEVTTVHDSAVEYRNEQANLINDVRSDDWLYEYKYSITDDLPTSRSGDDQRAQIGRASMSVSWSADSSNLFRLETSWHEPTYSQPSHSRDASKPWTAFWLMPNDIHPGEPGSNVWGIGMWTRAWHGIGHNLNVGPDWMQPVYGMDAVKTWVHTYPERKQLTLSGGVSIRDQAAAGQGPVRVIMMVTDASTGNSRSVWDATLRTGSASASYSVSTTTDPGDRVHFLAHQTNELHDGSYEGRTFTEAHILDWTPKVAVASVAGGSTATSSGSGSESEVVYPPSVSVGGMSYRVLQDNGAGLNNPRMGIQHAIYDNFLQHYGGGTPPSETLEWFDGLSTVYIRVPWSFVQQEDGKFVWSRVDEILDYWGLRGKRAGFRFSAFESEHQATPVYVKDLPNGDHGERAHIREFFGRVWRPEWHNAVFLKEYRELLDEFVERYDGDPRVDYIEVGSAGRWGEGSGITEAQSTLHADMFEAAFKGSSIRVLFGSAHHRSFLATERGFGIYDDSIGFSTGNNDQAVRVWRDATVRMEYGQLFERDFWLYPDPLRLLRVMESYHASYYFPHAFPDRFWAHFSHMAKAVARRVGYRFNITDAYWSEQPEVGRAAWFNLGLRNEGVAPNLDGGHVGIALINGDDVAETVYGGFNTADLPVAATQKRKSGYTEALAVSQGVPLRTGHSDAEVARLSIPVQIPADFPAGEADVAVFIRRPRDYSIRDRRVPKPVVGDWLERAWEYYELPYDNRVEHADGAFSYIIGKINIGGVNAVSARVAVPGGSPVRTHTYLDQHSRSQGVLDDSYYHNDWTYRWASVPAGDYTPLAGVLADMEHRSSGSDRAWSPSAGTISDNPRIGGSNGIEHISPGADRDAVLQWTNTTGTQAPAIMSGIITKNTSEGDGIRVSVVHDPAAGSDSVLWGPTLIGSADPVPFSATATLAAGDRLSLVVNAVSTSTGDAASLANLVVVDASTGAGLVVPAAADFDVSYRNTSLGDLNDDDPTDDWLYRWIEGPAGATDYVPMKGTITDMVWTYDVGWTPSADDSLPQIGDASPSSRVQDRYYTSNLIAPGAGLDAVVSWRNTTRGDITPIVVYGKLDPHPNCGNGVKISLVKNTDTVLWGPVVVNSTGDDPIISAATTVTEGDDINLVVNADGNDTDCDKIRAHYSILIYDGLKDYTHIFREEASTTQGLTTNTNITDNWLYRGAQIPAGDYTPLSGTIENLTHETRTFFSSMATGWFKPDLSVTVNKTLHPRIGSGSNFNFVHPGNDLDMVLTWVNTSDTTEAFLGGSVTVSGTIHAFKNGACDGDQDGIRFSIVKNTDTVLLGPLEINDTERHPFYVTTSIADDDHINLVINSGIANQNCDGTRLHGLTIHRYPTEKPSHKGLKPRATST